ncbi:MAG: hypothetical protein ACTSUT_14080 [Promethearchaeota archaeon]
MANYSKYKVKLKVQPLVGEIPWSHNLIILDRTKNAYENNIMKKHIYFLKFDFIFYEKGGFNG